MVHGTRDWGTARGETYLLSDDLAELAARVFSINTYDRRGKVVWWDDFRGGKNGWRTSVNGTGAAIVLDTTYPKWSPFHVKMTAGSDGGRWAKFYKMLEPWGVDAFGVEVSVCFPTAYSHFVIRMRYVDGVNDAYGEIKLDDVNDKVYCLDENLAYQEIGTILRVVATDMPYTVFKLVVDFSTDKYVRFMYDNQEYDLSAYSCYSIASATSRWLYVWFELGSRSGYNDYCYVDGVVVTEEEE